MRRRSLMYAATLAFACCLTMGVAAQDSRVDIVLDGNPVGLDLDRSSAFTQGDGYIEQAGQNYLHPAHSLPDGDFSVYWDLSWEEPSASGTHGHTIFAKPRSNNVVIFAGGTEFTFRLRYVTGSGNADLYDLGPFNDLVPTGERFTLAIKSLDGHWSYWVNGAKVADAADYGYLFPGFAEGDTPEELGIRPWSNRVRIFNWTQYDYYREEPMPYVGTEKLTIPELPAAPVLDGTASDVAWEGAEWLQVADDWQANPVHLPDTVEDFSARFKIGHYDDRIYLFVDVTDDEDDASNPEFWAKDAVELFFDLSRLGGDMGDFAAQRDAWESTGGPVQFRFHYSGDQVDIADSPYVSDTVNFVTNNDTPGKTLYEIELIPPADILPLLDITSFGFVMHIVDADGGEYRHSIAWWGGPDRPAGEYNNRPDTGGGWPWQSADHFAEAGFAPAEVVIVPDVVGLPQAEAETAIVDAELEVGSVTQAYSDDVSEGHVISQDPEADEVAPIGSAVNLVVSLGPEPVADTEVPNVVIEGEWYTLEEVEAALAEAGLIVGSITYEYSATVPEGAILGQNPPAGSSVPAGSGVNLIVSRGPAPSLPTAGWMALAALTALGLLSGIVVLRRRVQ